MTGNGHESGGPQTSPPAPAPSTEASPASVAMSRDSEEESTWAQKVTASKEIVWQWKHRTGFKDYDARASGRIEAAFQKGESHVRLKTGKFKKTPMEVFFVDMLQHDPITGNNREIRRIGPDSRWQRFKRLLNEWIAHIETGRPRRLEFAQYEKKRRALLDKVDEKDYKVTDYYKQSGCFARVAKAIWFQLLTMIFILLNTLWMGLDAQFNENPESMETDVWQVGEHVFCVVFTIEIIIRFGAFEKKRACLWDTWFVFDSTLVFFMILETWVFRFYLVAQGAKTFDTGGASVVVLRLLRLLRLTRLGRVVRLLRIFPDILYMLKGITLAVRSVLCTVGLLISLMFLFAIIFRQQAAVDEELNEMFPSVTESMWVLLLQGTLLDDVTDFVHALRLHSAFLTFLFLVYVFVGCWTILNMLVGIIVEVVGSVSKNEQEEAAVLYLKSTLLEILECHDKDDDRHIHRDEFEMLLNNPDMHAVLTKFNVSVGDLIALKDVLFEQKRTVFEEGSSSSDEEVDNTSPGTKMTKTVTGASAMGKRVSCATVKPTDVTKVSFSVFIEAVLRLRGQNYATVRDLTDLREYIRHRFDYLEFSKEQASCEVQPYHALRDAGSGSDGSPGSADASPVVPVEPPLRPQDVHEAVSSVAMLRAEMRELRAEISGLRRDLSFVKRPPCLLGSVHSHGGIPTPCSSTVGSSLPEVIVESPPHHKTPTSLNMTV
eukprot:TRINITY_DN112099_c0_g1_i1.p1 TRINITY_DN112099_c0_g1~~TRINITY_DN112099_c0_g1_i1.p1  ORF type:complete len:716 (+),score=89.37 TRINITY_DN112099_c0_g1_i1:98-2245(+)